MSFLSDCRWTTELAILVFLGAVELRNTVTQLFGVELAATAIFDYATIDALARHIVSRNAPVHGASNSNAGSNSSTKSEGRDSKAAIIQLLEVHYIQIHESNIRLQQHDAGAS